MRLGMASLVLAYFLSQFYRAFLAVLSPMLERDLGARAEDLALASGLWFLTFALAQLPVGAALDRFGPRRTAGVLLAFGGGGGAFLFAGALAPWHIMLAMGLIGIGCAPVLMASMFIFARLYQPAVFATLSGLLIGVGSLGNILGAWPLGWAAETFGWRASMAGIALISLLTGAWIVTFVKDPARTNGEEGDSGHLWDVFRIPALWPILAMLLVNYAPPGALRGLWVGPYIAAIYDEALIGLATLVMALAMVVGVFVYGPLDRWFGTRKGVALIGNLIAMLCLFVLAWEPAPSFFAAVVLLAAVGFFGMSYPVLMAHGRAFLPPHLLGRGLTLLNMASIGGVGLAQIASRAVYTQATSPRASEAPPEAAFGALFLFFAVILLIGCLIYMTAKDRTD